MAEAIIRQHRRRKDRWIPREKRRITRAQVQGVLRFAVQAVPGLLLSFAEVLGIPSGLHAAYATACAAVGRDVRPVLAGNAISFLIRGLSGIPIRWEMLITLALLAVTAVFLYQRNTILLMVMTGAVMLPTAIAATQASTAAEMVQGWASVGMAALSAPVMVRALQVLKGKRHISALEERVAVGYLAAMCICGGARMILLGMNVGMLLACGTTLTMALVLGVGAASMTGLLGGIVLSLQGMPMDIPVALSMGGFLAGIANSLSRRWLSCVFFAVGSMLPLLLCGAAGAGCGAAVMAAAAGLSLLPRRHYEWLQQLLRRFLANDPVPGDAYAASALTAWEKTVAAMALAVPSPQDAEISRDGQWWENRLCQGCPECAECGVMTTALGISRAEAVWEYRYADAQVWQDALDMLRAMGCRRLYFLMDAMNSLRQEDESNRRVIRQAEAQREMLVTHLNAMSGAARRFASLSSGESWWDDMAARRIRKELAQRATPASLSYVRRIQGHVQAVYELQLITGARKQAEELCMLSAAVLDVPMQLSELDGDRVYLRECPLLQAETGIAAEAAEDGEVCGDTAWTGMLQDGRYLAALSDGMGHGSAAALSSRQTVELIRLCLDAGYTRQQTLTAVNGMMLLGGGGERFATADVLVIDLWKGHAALDKLGAASSWVYQQGRLTRIAGDALPLGIIEEIGLCGSDLRLSEGDAVILLSDGVEEAFSTPAPLEEAILAALKQETPQAAAQMLLASALEADGGRRADDQSAVVVYIRSSRGR